jgi:chromosome segregation ATPase
MFSTLSSIGIGVVIGLVLGFLLTHLWITLRSDMTATLRNDIEQARVTTSTQKRKLEALEANMATNLVTLTERAEIIRRQEERLRNMDSLQTEVNHLRTETAMQQRTVERLENFNRDITVERDYFHQNHAEARATVTRLELFETEAKELRPCVQELESLVRSQGRKMQALRIQLGETEEKRENLLTRFDFVNQTVVGQAKEVSELKLKLRKSVDSFKRDRQGD